MAEDREVVDGDDGRDLGAHRPAKGGAVKDVEAAGASPYPERVPGGVADDRRKLPAAAERQELELETLAAAEGAEEPADMTRRAGAGLDERRGVEADLHASTPSRRATASTAARGSQYSSSSTASAAVHQR